LEFDRVDIFSAEEGRLGNRERERERGGGAIKAQKGSYDIALLFL
jgi:hypothetical protein